MNQPVSEGRVHLGYVPQFATFRRDFPLSVQETVMHGRLGLRKWWSGMNNGDKQAVENAMRATSVLDLARRPISQLSGGQMQRVLIARALATAPQVLLLDEPTAHVDSGSERELFDLLAQLREHMSIVLVSHDVGLVSQHVDHIACMHQTLECHPAGGVASDSFQRLYGMPVSLVDHHHHHNHHAHAHHSHGHPHPPTGGGS
jgi:zinc transport system ATP-binding protein